jgi:hypothetical protein
VRKHKFQHKIFPLFHGVWLWTGFGLVIGFTGLFKQVVSTRLAFSVTVFTALSGSGFQQCSVLGFRVQRLLSSLAGTSPLQLPSRTNWLSNAENKVQTTPYITSVRTLKKTSPNSSSLVVSRSYRTDRVEKTASQLLRLLHVTNLLPSNVRICRAVP